MAEGIQVDRDARKRLSGRGVGLRPEQPNTLPVQQRGVQAGVAAHVVALPQDVSRWQPLQVTNTASPYLGYFYFLPGYDIPGDPTKIIR